MYLVTLTKPGSTAILVIALLAIVASGRAQTLAITGGTIIDGTGKAPLNNGVVLVRDGRITAVGPATEVAVPKVAQKIDARGKYVIPGLMDANVHLALSHFSLTLEALLRYEDRFPAVILEAAQIALRTGLTTVFDTYGPRAALITARDRINAGESPGSRIYLAGNVIGSYGPIISDYWLSRSARDVVSQATRKRIDEMYEQGVGRELQRMQPEAVRSAVREYTHKGIDFLKYISDWGDAIAFSPRVQRVIVEEGHRAGMSVQAHVGYIESIDQAIEAGLDILTHGERSGAEPIPEETIRKIVERGIAVSVLPETQRRLDALEKHKAAPESRLLTLKVSKTNRRNMIAAGVTLLLSTDAEIFDPVLLAESRTLVADTVDPLTKIGEGHFNSLVALEEEGMEPMEILKSATSHIARAYKLDAKIGTLEPGKVADLVILDANPLESARNYRRIQAVIKEGKIVDRNALPVAPIISAKPVTN